MFYVGQKVVSLKDCTVLNEGDVVTVTGIEACTHCGEIYICYDRKLPFMGKKAPCYECSIGSTPKLLTLGYWRRDAKSFATIEEYSDSMSIAMQLIQELDQVDKAKNPIKEGAKV